VSRIRDGEEHLLQAVLGPTLLWSQREQLFGVTISAAGFDLLRAVELDDGGGWQGNAKWWMAK
jgi:hypothetical protein